VRDVNIRSPFTADHLVHMCQSRNFTIDKQQAGKEKVKKQKVSIFSILRAGEEKPKKEINKREVQTAGGRVIAYSGEEKHTFLHQ